MIRCMWPVIWRPSLVRRTAVLTWRFRPLRNSSVRARPQKCPLELGRHLLGGVGRSSLLDVERRWSFSVLADNLLSNVSRNRQTVFVWIESPWPGSALPWALVLWVLCQVLQLGSALGSVLQNPHLAWWAWFDCGFIAGHDGVHLFLIQSWLLQYLSQTLHSAHYHLPLYSQPSRSWSCKRPWYAIMGEKLMGLRGG
jgi:hypothetical protein